jgi:glutamate carboxypeptidase
VSVAVQGRVDRPPMEADDRSRALWMLIQETAAAMGLPIDSIATGGCSDGNFASALGVPTIDGMGLIGANAHRQDGYLEVDSIVPQVHLVAAVCEAIARVKG